MSTDEPYGLSDERRELIDGNADIQRQRAQLALLRARGEQSEAAQARLQASVHTQKKQEDAADTKDLDPT